LAARHVVAVELAAALAEGDAELALRVRQELEALTMERRGGGAAESDA
jgi:hypothetical protein